MWDGEAEEIQEMEELSSWPIGFYPELTIVEISEIKLLYTA
jgi:hypothetical protein